MRRVVTGPAEAGDAAILLDGGPPTVIEAGKYTTTELWVTDGSPPLVQGAAQLRAFEPSARPWALEPPPQGSCFRIVQIAPESEVGPVPEPEPATAAEDADPGFLEEHTTSTLDYVVVISGEVTLTVGASEVTLGPGDVVVQQGVAHDWRNHGNEPCVLAGVLLSTRQV